MLVTTLFLIFVGFGLSEQRLFPNENNTLKSLVIRVQPSNHHQLQFLHERNFCGLEAHVWNPASSIGSAVNLLIHEANRGSIQDCLTKNGFTPTVYGLEKLIEDETIAVKQRMLTNPSDLDNSKAFDFGNFYSYNDIVSFMQRLSQEYSSIAEPLIVGNTAEGRSIVGLKIGTPKVNPKPSIYIDGNIQGRDWLTSGVALYIIGQLVLRHQDDQHIQHLVDNYDWYIVPVTNPDGYEYTRRGNDTRAWNKNTRKQQCSFYGCCSGVDLNRNFDASWGGAGAINDPCNDAYAGTEAFSEVESQGIRDTITKLKDNLKAIITLHSYGQTWLVPYGDIYPPQYPTNYIDLLAFATDATVAVKGVHGRQYIVENAAFSGPAAGAHDDWAKRIIGIKQVHAVELPPQPKVPLGFVRHISEIIPTGEEVFAGIIAIANHL